MKARSILPVFLCAILAPIAPAAEAQIGDTGRVLGREAPRLAGQPARESYRGTGRYDVVLEVPELSVDSIGLTVRDLNAHVTLEANAANLVSLTAGADVRIRRVELELTGVVAEAYLYVDLDNVARVVDRVVTSLDNNADLLVQLLTTVDTLVGVVGDAGATALRPGGPVDRTVGALGGATRGLAGPGGLLAETVDQLGRTVQRTVDRTGGITDVTLDRSGNVLGSRALGSVLDLPLLRETRNAAGQVVREVRDPSGGVIEYTSDAAGAAMNVRVRDRAPTRP